MLQVLSKKRGCSLSGVASPVLRSQSTVSIETFEQYLVTSIIINRTMGESQGKRKEKNQCSVKKYIFVFGVRD